MMRVMMMLFCFAILLAGCATLPESTELADNTVIVKSAQSPRPIHFPTYFLMEGVQLNDHGYIPSTSLIGADMTTALDLRTVRSRFGDILAKEGWHTDKMEIARQSFRLMASRERDTVEIRAVQGTGPTQIFLLYTPALAMNQNKMQQ